MLPAKTQFVHEHFYLFFYSCKNRYLLAENVLRVLLSSLCTYADDDILSSTLGSFVKYTVFKSSLNSGSLSKPHLQFTQICFHSKTDQSCHVLLVWFARQGQQTISKTFCGLHICLAAVNRDDKRLHKPSDRSAVLFHFIMALCKNNNNGNKHTCT